MEAPEVWWAHYIAVKQELVETVLQDLPPASGARDAGPDSAAARAAWDAPRPKASQARFGVSTCQSSWFSALGNLRG